MMDQGVALLGVGRKHEDTVPVFDLHSKRVLGFRVNDLEYGQPETSRLQRVINDAVLEILDALDLMTTRGQGIEAGLNVPFVDSPDMVDDLRGAGWSPDL